jgi:hypothetical protein
MPVADKTKTLFHFERRVGMQTKSKHGINFRVSPLFHQIFFGSSVIDEKEPPRRGRWRSSFASLRHGFASPYKPLWLKNGFPV